MGLNNDSGMINECLDSYVEVAYLDSDNDFDVINERRESYNVQLV